jgi:hypothetical protein
MEVGGFVVGESKRSKVEGFTISELEPSSHEILPRMMEGQELFLKTNIKQFICGARIRRISPLSGTRADQAPTKLNIVQTF